MTKKEIVRLISEKSGLTQLKTKAIVQLTFDAIIDSLVENGRIELRNFGVFEVRQRRARKARNPRTYSTIDVPAKKVVHFQAGKEMDELIRGAKTVGPSPKKGSKPAKPVTSESVSPSTQMPEFIIADEAIN
jgi:nucleoid DNA-binding protein